MGKKRIIEKEGAVADGAQATSGSKGSRRRVAHAVLHVQATYNNTLLSLTDPEGNVLAWSSSGSLGFKGAKKGTPFAAAKVGELLGDKGVQVGVKEVDVMVRGVGSGRESSIRAFAGKGISISSIQDLTPVPHNGPRPKKARRV